MKRFYYKWTPSRVEKLLRLHAAKMKYKDIAEELGCSESAIKMKTKELRSKGLLEKRIS